jgi:bla regulator protein blaR1
MAAIVNHLWQSTAVTLAVAMLAFWLRNDAARLRYGLWLAASIKYLIPFSLLAALGERLAGSAPALDVFGDWSSVARLAAPVTQPPSSQMLLALLAGVWVTGTALVVHRWFSRAAQLHALIGHTEVADEALPLGAAGLRVRYSAARMEPGIVGLARPVLVLPQTLRNRLEPAELETVIAHEICHWRRRDNVTAAIHMLVEAVFWFHPFVWWIGARLIEEREHACDEAVVAGGHDRETYARTILEVCECCAPSPLACASGVSGGELKDRITRIMRRQKMKPLTVLKKSLLSAGACAALLAPVIAGLLSNGAALAQAGQDVREFLPIVKVAPVYPRAAAEMGLEGYVIVEYTVTREGSVRDAVVVESSSSLFEEAALESTLKYKYQPRVVDGAPVDLPGVRTIIKFELGQRDI